MKQTREQKLDIAQRKHRDLLLKHSAIHREWKTLDNKRRKVNGEIHKVGQAIYDLKHSGDTPTVTDHAIVRYLERVEGIDISELKLKVMGDKNAHREGNVIVTVNASLVTAGHHNKR